MLIILPFSLSPNFLGQLRTLSSFHISCCRLFIPCCYSSHFHLFDVIVGCAMNEIRIAQPHVQIVTARGADVVKNQNRLPQCHPLLGLLFLLLLLVFLFVCLSLFLFCFVCCCFCFVLFCFLLFFVAVYTDLIDLLCSSDF